MNETSKERQWVWDPKLYEAKHAFVWQNAADLIVLLAPKPGESILDAGCGTGHLTSQIASAGTNVIGVDRSEEMVEAARKEYPGLNFEVADVRELPYRDEFDAVFSNATLHWIREPQRAIASIWKALRYGGRFVAEFGGKGNIRKMQDAFVRALEEINVMGPDKPNPWYFPSVAEYAALLEKQGFEIHSVALFDRPTPLQDGKAGLRNWLSTFGHDFYAYLPLETQQRFLRRVEDLLQPELFRDGQWIADYRRLRLEAVKSRE